MHVARWNRLSWQFWATQCDDCLRALCAQMGFKPGATTCHLLLGMQGSRPSRRDADLVGTTTGTPACRCPLPNASSSLMHCSWKAGMAMGLACPNGLHYLGYLAVPDRLHASNMAQKRALESRRYT